MNELYQSSMARRRRAAVRRAGRRHRRRRRQREEDLLRRRQPQEHGPAPPRTTPTRSSRWARPSRPACAGSRRSREPVVAAINGAALGGGLEIALAANHRIAVDDRYGQDRPARGRRSACCPAAAASPASYACSACSPALMDVLLQGTQFKPAAAPGEGPGRRARRDPRGAGPGREGVDQGQRRRGRRAEPVGPRRLQDARRHPEDPGARGVPAGVPGAAAQADQGCDLPGAARDPVAPRSRARRSTSTPPRASSRATSTNLVVNQQARRT